MQQETPLISVVLPCHNEQDNISPIVDALVTILQSLGDSYEILLVDDGSSDDTWSHMKAAARNYSDVIGIKLSRNFGHQPALLAGLSRAQGQAIISMDSDLQHPPHVIEQLITEWKRGYKIVNTCRKYTTSVTPFKKATSRYFYMFFSYMAEVPIQEGASDFRLLDHQVLVKLLEFAHADGFIRGSIQWMGFPTTTVAYQAEPRFSGESSYSFSRMTRFAVTAITSFSTKPLVLGVWLGMFVAALSMFELLYIIIQSTRGVTVPGWASTLGVTSLLFGFLFALLGVFGIYLSRIYSLVQAKPYFIVDESTLVQQVTYLKPHDLAEYCDHKNHSKGPTLS